jgi:hypothetical protein
MTTLARGALSDVRIPINLLVAVDGFATFTVSFAEVFEGAAGQQDLALAREQARVEGHLSV